MIEVTNKMKSPVQLVVRSRRAPRSFTTLNIPGRGAGKNVRLLADELHTEYFDRLEKDGLISTKYIPNNEIRKGD
jgi:hypothetical protein